MLELIPALKRNVFPHSKSPRKKAAEENSDNYGGSFYRVVADINARIGEERGPKPEHDAPTTAQGVILLAAAQEMLPASPPTHDPYKEAAQGEGALLSDKEGQYILPFAPFPPGVIMNERI